MLVKQWWFTIVESFKQITIKTNSKKYDASHKLKMRDPKRNLHDIHDGHTGKLLLIKQFNSHLTESFSCKKHQKKRPQNQPEHLTIGQVYLYLHVPSGKLT